MALQLKDRVRTACTTVGTGNIIVGSNRAGYQNWDAITNGNTVYYCIIECNAWEVGHGVKTDGEITRTLIASSTGSLIDLKGTEDVFETYPADKAVILDVDGNLTVDGDVFADNLYTKTATDTLLDSKANVGDSYTKAETYSNVEIDGELFKKADKTDTYTKAEVDATQDAQNTNINSNTTAIGTLSGKVATNTADIATLQDGIFFSSSYTTDYPASVNRDPGTGNIYLQNLSAFTYSYADANQAFISKTDEQGNVRQFTAVKPDYIIVLNQVESANYGRYKVSTVNDMGTYVNVILEFQTGEGTVLEGDTLALQAFPASAGGSGDSIWTEEGNTATYDGNVNVANGNLKQTQTDAGNVQESIVIRNNSTSDGTGSLIRFINSTDPNSKPNGASVGTERIGDNNSLVLTTKNIERMRIDGEGGVSTTHDITVKGKTVVTEAPEDGKQYARKDATWTEVTGGGSGPSVETAIGMVAPFAMDSVPEGWLHCDGSAVSRDTYSLLYSKVGYTYGEGDGSTTFNLPDLQDEFIRGSSDTLAVGNKQADEFKAHTHSTENPRKPTGGTVGGTSNTPAAAPSGGGRGSVTATGGD